MGHLRGYARVSTTDQQPQLQVDALTAAGCYRVFVESGVDEMITPGDYERSGAIGHNEAYAILMR